MSHCHSVFNTTHPIRQKIASIARATPTSVGRQTPGLTAWLADADADSLYLSIITIGEIAWGIERLLSGTKRATLERWLRDDVLGSFPGRVSPVDIDVVGARGRVCANAERFGKNAEARDTLVGTTAIRDDLILVTRKLRSDEVRCFRLVRVNPTEWRMM